MWVLDTPPPRLTTYRGTLHWLAIHFDEILSCFVPNVFLWIFCIIKWSKLGSYLHNTNIWHHLWSKFGYRVTPYCSAINFAKIPSCFVLNVFLWLLCIIKWFKLGSYMHNNNIWHILLVKIWVFDPPGVTIYMVTTYCVSINFEEIPSCFILNVFLWLLCVIKWSKLG
jgi:hypothetical protein